MLSCCRSCRIFVYVSSPPVSPSSLSAFSRNLTSVFGVSRNKENVPAASRNGAIDTAIDWNGKGDRKSVIKPTNSQALKCAAKAWLDCSQADLDFCSSRTRALHYCRASRFCRRFSAGCSTVCCRCWTFSLRVAVIFSVISSFAEQLFPPLQLFFCYSNCMRKSGEARCFGELFLVSLRNAIVGGAFDAIPMQLYCRVKGKGIGPESELVNCCREMRIGKRRDKWALIEWDFHFNKLLIKL